VTNTVTSILGFNLHFPPHLEEEGENTNNYVMLAVEECNSQAFSERIMLHVNRGDVRTHFAPVGPG
jgi:hypothetical protein